MFDPNEPIVLDLGLEEETKPAVVETELAQPEAQPEIVLSPEEQAMVDAFSQKIDLHNTSIILQYGAASQKKIANFSDTVLEGVKTKELGETGEMISDLVAELKGFSADEEEGGFLGFFKKSGTKA
jgi:uncharacterized protein YaaN involved in tellurite resistance